MKRFKQFLNEEKIKLTKTQYKSKKPATNTEIEKYIGMVKEYIARGEQFIIELTVDSKNTINLSTKNGKDKIGFFKMNSQAFMDKFGKYYKSSEKEFKELFKGAKAFEIRY